MQFNKLRSLVVLAQASNARDGVIVVGVVVRTSGEGLESVLCPFDLGLGVVRRMWSNKSVSSKVCVFDRGIRGGLDKGSYALRVEQKTRENNSEQPQPDGLPEITVALDPSLHSR